MSKLAQDYHERLNGVSSVQFLKMIIDHYHVNVLQKREDESRAEAEIALMMFWESIFPDRKWLLPTKRRPEWAHYVELRSMKQLFEQK